MTTLADLVTPMTRTDAEAAIYAALAARGVTTTGWKPGAVVRAIVTAFAIVIAALSQLQAMIAKSGFLDLAEGDWLTAVASYVYGVTRDSGSFATGTVTLTNAGAGVYSGSAGDLIFSNSTTGKQYRNTGSYNLLATSTLDVAVQAIELGSASTANPTAIDTLVTTLTGVTCSNAVAIVGTDAEEDEALRIRCREKTGAASPNGPKDAYGYFARSAVRSDGTSIGVTRVKSVPDGFGNLDVYVATATGGVTGTYSNPATDLGAVHAAIQANCVPIGITEVTHTATLHSIAVTYELWVRDSVSMTSAQLQAAISTAITTYLSRQPIGGEVVGGTGYIYVSALSAVIGSCVPAGGLVRVDVTLPAANVTIAATEAPAAGTITCTAINTVASVNT